LTEVLVIINIWTEHLAEFTNFADRIWSVPNLYVEGPSVTVQFH